MRTCLPPSGRRPCSPRSPRPPGRPRDGAPAGERTGNRCGHCSYSTRRSIRCRGGWWRGGSRRRRCRGSSLRYGTSPPVMTRVPWRNSCRARPYRARRHRLRSAPTGRFTPEAARAGQAPTPDSRGRRASQTARASSDARTRASTGWYRPVRHRGPGSRPNSQTCRSRRRAEGGRPPDRDDHARARRRQGASEPAGDDRGQPGRRAHRHEDARGHQREHEVDPEHAREPGGERHGGRDRHRRQRLQARIGPVRARRHRAEQQHDRHHRTEQLHDRPHGRRDAGEQHRHGEARRGQRADGPGHEPRLRHHPAAGRQDARNEGRGTDRARPAAISGSPLSSSS